ncbi:acyl-CoA dehydrogenase family protein [Sphingomonas colocasiae]|uniref:Acyl-CoA dehydrogenase family protein n=1 Tax=Sphingomonas colocasiae TaxID=1848973 RepID=A0ABS7PSS5_9SPHN|nr:acyl-CoA dehydrogenase family protein [Sphingomonas colocasiae]MBY8824397.1 acyl-CoA dehydrogenase family protein [Sphingomonas colocasiae]
MDFDLPSDLTDYLATLDRFIADEIAPLQAADDNERFFDHRREWARTDWDRGGLPRHDWEDLLAEAKRRADAAGHLRFALPAAFGGRDGGNLAMAVIREHLAAKGLGLHNDLQNEHSIVGNFPTALMIRDFGTDAQREALIPGILDGSLFVAFGLTEPDHGSDATHMETRAVRESRDGVAGWRIDGEKMWITGMHVASHCLLFARTDGAAGDATGISCFVMPNPIEGLKIEEYLWTFNMPTDHPRMTLDGVWLPEDAILGTAGDGLVLAQHFVHENRIRQAASSLGAAVYCIEESIAYARARKPFGKPLAANQGIQFPLVELATQAEMLRQLIYKTAWEMDRMPKPEVEKRLSDKVSMCNYWANRLVCEAADRAMQVHGGIGYSRHKPFEHIYRHHRRYRITEGAEEIQMRKVGAWLFGYAGPRRHAGGRP